MGVLAGLVAGPSDPEYPEPGHSADAAAVAVDPSVLFVRRRLVCVLSSYPRK